MYFLWCLIFHHVSELSITAAVLLFAHVLAERSRCRESMRGLRCRCPSSRRRRVSANCRKLTAGGCRSHVMSFMYTVSSLNWWRICTHFATPASLEIFVLDFITMVQVSSMKRRFIAPSSITGDHPSNHIQQFL